MPEKKLNSQIGIARKLNKKSGKFRVFFLKKSGKNEVKFGCEPCSNPNSNPKSKPNSNPDPTRL